MAWIYKRNDSELWWIGTRANGRQILKSTGERDRAKAEAQLAAVEAMEAAQRAGRLNREFFEALTGAHVEVVRLFDALDTWLAETTNPNTKANYGNFAKQIKAAMARNPILSDITHEQVRSFLAGIRAKKRASTANLGLSCAQAFFGRFIGALRKNPAEGIPRFKDDGTEIEREAFTPEQIRTIVAVASPFWRCATAIAFFTGLRLSNIAKLKVGQIDLKHGRVQVARTVKTGSRVCVKIPASVVAMVRGEIQPGARADDYIWPDRAAIVENVDVSILSGEFGQLLIEAGIRKEQVSAGNGKAGRRNVNALTFHSLRHAIVTALANRGVNQQTVKQLVGHSSERINDAYTHIGQDTIDAAAALLPDITKGDK